jgi:hypothetical protein
MEKVKTGVEIQYLKAVTDTFRKEEKSYVLSDFKNII